MTVFAHPQIQFLEGRKVAAVTSFVDSQFSIGLTITEV